MRTHPLGALASVLLLLAVCVAVAWFTVNSPKRPDPLMGPSSVTHDPRSGAQTATAEYDSLRVQMSMDKSLYHTSERIPVRLTVTNLSAATYHVDNLPVQVEFTAADTDQFIVGMQTPFTYFKQPPPVTLRSGESTTVTLTVPAHWSQGVTHLASMDWPVEARARGGVGMIAAPDLLLLLDK